MMKLPTFMGGIEPLKAETWMLETEKLFEVLMCSKAQKVLLATYTLKEKAHNWWMLIRHDNGAMTCDQFKEIFYEKYFPQCFRDRKVLEFEQLKQGFMSVAEYKAKFTELAHFAPHMPPKYVNVLDQALMTETNLAAMKQTKAQTTELRGKRFGFNSRKGRSISKKQNTGSSSISSQSSGTSPTYSECGRKQKGPCYRSTGACFWCGKIGHMMKDCPLTIENSNRPVASSAESTPALRTNTRADTR
ncbi:uncharacterized protein LOC114299014 [Camellia sinensis]|uniref:uncharacterized protein LOC114299014 n=1 Tax=Camellia sinensis TaxID=4442 RepID=UPI001035E004|nr:uncharacterized protein LOC114299014 [Camellia sinensis]